ncbi:hypothetical protein [Synechococcus sp. MIT S9452]|uniref:hypothetical protein n=1 Tax=Synechococcus sp. MIT S9452 TaxID=3082546 RepID=UPI0039A5C35B
MTTKLSILIPTWKRYPGLYRNLLYINYLLTSGNWRLFFSQVEFIIADGTPVGFDPEKCYPLLLALIEKLQASINLVYLHAPEQTYLARIALLASKSTSRYVMVVGDDDLIVPNYLLECVDFLDSNIRFKCVAGRQINILGFSGNSLKFDDSDRFFYGASVTVDNCIGRFIQYQTLNMVGCPSLYYAIQARELLSNFARLCGDKESELFYGGLELIHQTLTLKEGFVKLSNLPTVLRDFTYLNYFVEEERVAPSSDAYPYYGIGAVRIVASLLKDTSGFNQHCKDPFGLLDSIFNASAEILPSQQRVRGNLNSQLVQQNLLQLIPLETCSLAFRVWRETLVLRYGPNSKSTLGFKDSFILRFLVDLRSRFLAYLKAS